MTAAAPGGADHMPHMEGLGDKGAGESSLFSVKDLGLLPNVMKTMFQTAENTLAQAFGPVSDLLPYKGGGDNQQV